MIKVQLCTCERILHPLSRAWSIILGIFIKIFKIIFHTFFNPLIKNHNIHDSSMLTAAWRRNERDEKDRVIRQEWEIGKKHVVPRRREPPTYAIKCSKIWLAALSPVRPSALLLSGPKTTRRMCLFCWFCSHLPSDGRKSNVCCWCTCLIKMQPWQKHWRH